jgi:hypothetical protein
MDRMKRIGFDVAVAAAPFAIFLGIGWACAPRRLRHWR